MSQEFKIKNGLIVSGDATISGAATVNGNSVIHTGNVGSYTVTSLTDTLATVTGRGATTTSAVTVGSLSSTGNINLNGGTLSFNTNYFTINNGGTLARNGGSIALVTDGTTGLSMAPNAGGNKIQIHTQLLLPQSSSNLALANASATDLGLKFYASSLMIFIAGGQDTVKIGTNYFATNAPLTFGSQSAPPYINYNGNHLLINAGTLTTTGYISVQTGNLLVGTTTDSGYKLDVNGTARVSSSLRLDTEIVPAAGSYSNGPLISFVTSTGWAAGKRPGMSFWGQSNSGSYLYFDGSLDFKAINDTGLTMTFASQAWVSSQGYLTSTPTLAQVTTAGNTTTNAITVNKLSITGTGETYNMVVGSASDVTNWNQFISSEGTGEYGIWNDSFYFQPLSTLANGIRFYTSAGVAALNVFQTSNIGINTTTDAGYKLDVNGTARFSGNTYLAGDILVSNGSGTRYIQASNGSIGFLSSNSSGYNLWTNNSNVGIKSELYINSDLNYNTGIRLRIGSTQTSPSGYSYELSFQPGANHLPTHTAIRTLDSTYGGNSTVPSPLYIFGGQNTTTGTYAHVILQSDFTTNRGNVGIGTTNPSYKLDIVGETRIGSTSKVILGNDGTYSGYSGIGFGGTTNGYNRIFAYDGTSNGLFLCAATGRDINFRPNGSTVDVFTVAANNSLYCNSYLFASEDINYNRFYRPNGTVGIYLGASDAGNYYDNTTHYFRNSGGNTNYVTITSTGNVLVGTTTDAGYKLDVNGTARVLGTHRVWRDNQVGDIDLNLYNGQAGWQGGMYYHTESGGANQRLTFYSGGAIGTADALTITSSRNVGIGTTNPQSILEVRSAGVGNAGAVITLNRVGNWAASYCGLKLNTNDAGTDWWNVGMLATGTNTFNIGQNGSAMMSILVNGNIGIGTTTPGSKLDVNGVITATGGNSTNWNTAYGWGNHASQSYATTSYVTTQINNLINGAPGALDTLSELASALGNDASFATTVTNSIAGKMALYNGAGAPDFNTNTTNGIYRNQGGANGPAGGTHVTMFSAFQPDSNYGWQLASSSSDNLYFRFKDTSFNSWVQIATRSWVTSQNYVTTAGYNNSNWDIAYGWGNHASAGYALNSSLANYLPLSGGVIGGAVTINGNLTVNGTITENSSIKLKENVQTSEGNLEKVVNLRPVTYNKIGSQTTELGLIAEEVAEVYPEFVQYDENGEPVGVHYSRLTAALIGAVKELTNQVQELNKKING